MHNRLLWIVAIVVFFLGGGWWLRGQAPINPTVSAPILTPSLVTITTPTRVIARVYIPDPTLNPTSVELIRVNRDGTRAAVARMTDDGRDADQMPGDKTFTAAFTLNEVQLGQFGFQVSAAFRGRASTVSVIQQFVALAPHVLPVILPPDPGVIGKTTLAGIDSDNDGVRDDVQRGIVFLFLASEKLRVASTQYAKVMQQVLLNATDEQLSIANIRKLLRAQTCTNYNDISVGANLVSHKEVDTLYLNTYPRARAYYTADAHFSGHFLGIPDGQEAAQCDVNPASLPN